MENIEVKVRVKRKIFYNSESMWGVFAVIPLTNKDKFKLNKYGNIVVNGNSPELLEEKEYDMVLQPAIHPKYGDGFNIVSVKYQRPTSIKEQQDYIRLMLTENQANAILNKYPNHPILDMMKNGTFDYSDIKGIKEKTYQKIKRDLFANLDIRESLVELEELKITPVAMKKIVEHFGSPEVVIKKVKENIYLLCEVDGFGFSKVDKYALNRGDDEENPNRIIAAISYLLKKEEDNGHCWVSKDYLINNLLKLLQIEKDKIVQVIDDLKNNKKFYVDDNRVALYKNYFYEKEIKKHLYRLLNAESIMEIKDIDKRIKEIEESTGITYTDEQKNAIRLASQSNVFILNGKGGVGKTTVLKGILNVHKNYNHACCALSGKASRIMNDLGLNAFTIHKLLGYKPNSGFEYNQYNKLPYHIVVIDEASMCNNYLMYSVISAIEDGMKLIIVGDSGQLSSIGAGAVFEDLLKVNKFPQIELTKVHRQAAKSGILSIANTIRKGKQIIQSGVYEKQVFGELRDFVLFPIKDRSTIKDLVLEVAQALKHRKDEFQVITALKVKGDISVKALNIELQKIFNDITKPCVKRGGYEYRIGDMVIQNGNNYEAGKFNNIEVYNGTIGKIVDLYIAKNTKEKDKLFIKFQGIDEVICYEKEQIDQIELAYAISCHKSQGSTIPYTLFVFDYGAYTLLSRQFVYTGLTRASKGCVMICETNALRHAIRTDHGSSRNTFLYELLVGDDNG